MVGTGFRSGPTVARLAAVALLCLGLGVGSRAVQAEPPGQTALPEGFPAELAVPFAVPLVFLTGRSEIIGSDGRPQPHARHLEFSRNDTEDARRMMDHYLGLFAAEDWQGEVTGTGDQRSGSFEHEGVEATVRLRTRASGVLAFTMKVQVPVR